jgi:hypothetical protein
LFPPVVLQAHLNTGLDFCKEVLAFQIGTGVIIGESSALLWAGLMNSTALDHPVARMKDAGAVIFHLEGMTVFHEAFADLPIRNGKMPGQTVYVVSINKKDRTFKPVTAITWTVITVFHVFLLSYSNLR